MFLEKVLPVPDTSAASTQSDRPTVVVLVSAENPDEDVLTRAAWHARECGGDLKVIAFCGLSARISKYLGLKSLSDIRDKLNQFHPDDILIAESASDSGIGRILIKDSVNTVLTESAERSVLGHDPLAKVRRRIIDLARSRGIPVISAGADGGQEGLAWFLERNTNWPAALGLSTAAVALCTVCIAYLSQFMDATSLSIVFLTAVVYSATAFGFAPALFTTMLSFLVFSFAFVPPAYSLSFDMAEGALVIFVFAIVGAVASNLAGRLKDQTNGGRMRDRETSTLFMFTRDVATCPDDDMIPGVVLTHFMNLFGPNTDLLLQEEGRWTIWPTGQEAETEDAAMADIASAREGQIVPTPAREGAKRMALQLQATSDCFGVILTDRPTAMSTSLTSVTNSLCNLAALALERQQRNTEISNARLLKQSESLRSALMSSMSHDLGTPLASIIGSTTSLLNYGEKFDPRVARDLLTTTLEEAERLNRFVSNIMQMTKLEAGAIQPNRSWIAVDDLVHTTLDVMQRRLLDHDVYVDVEGPLPLVHIDTILLENVLTNLIENAIKYSDAHTTITLHGYEEEGQVVIAVSDEGVGIEPEDLEAVFDKFYRVKSRDRVVAGTGLGLAICKGIVEAHGGTIKALNRSPAAGTRMQITLPATPLPADDLEP